MTQNIKSFPRQRLPFYKKSANDFEWAKKTVDLLRSNNEYNQFDVYNYDNFTERSNYERKLSNYRLFNNILDQKDFERECNPFGLSVGQIKDEIQAYNKIPNKIHVLLSEEYKRPFNYRAILTNDSGIKSKEIERTSGLRDLIESRIESLIQFIQQSVQSKGADPEQVEDALNQAINELISPEEIEKYNSATYLSSKEKLANNILEYLFYNQSIKSKMNDAYKHSLISGEEYVWVGHRKGNPVIETLNSLNVFYHKDMDTKFVQNGLYAGYESLMSSGSVLDNFGQFMSEEDIKDIETDLDVISDNYGPSKEIKYPKNRHLDYWRTNHQLSETGSYGRGNSHEDWLVTHVEWRSQKKIYFVTAIDELGDPVKMIANEDFIIPPYAEKFIERGLYGIKKTKYSFDNIIVEESWVPEIWEGIQIGQDKYCCLGPKPFQSRSVEDPYNVKLGYHGVVQSNMNAAAIAPLGRMKPFQYLYFILVHKLKRLIARDKGQVYHFDVSMLPENMDIEKAIYYLEELDIDFYNPLANAETAGAASRQKITNATNRSNTQHIANYIQLMDSIDQQISDIAGIPKSREGQTAPSEAVTNVQQNLIQSSLVTETFMKEHSELWADVLQSTISITQEMWRDKAVRKQYVLDDLSVKTLELNPGDLDNADFGIFISNSGKDIQVFDTLKNLSQALIQNDKAKISDIIKIVKANSVEKLEEEILQSEKVLDDRAQQDRQFQSEQLQQQIQANKDLEEDKQSHEIDKLLVERETQLLVKSLENQNNEFKRQLEVEKLNLKDKHETRKLDIQEGRDKNPQ